MEVRTGYQSTKTFRKRTVVGPSQRSPKKGSRGQGCEDSSRERGAPDRREKVRWSLGFFTWALPFLRSRRLYPSTALPSRPHKIDRCANNTRSTRHAVCHVVRCTVSSADLLLISSMALVVDADTFRAGGQYVAPPPLPYQRPSW